MIQPIVFDKFGNRLSAYPGMNDKTPEHYLLRTCIGIHSCNGFVDHAAISGTHAALSCRKCNWRVHIPIDITTWAELVGYVNLEAKIS